MEFLGPPLFITTATPSPAAIFSKPEGYRWSSFNHYAIGELGPIEIECEWTHTAAANESGPITKARGCKPFTINS
jgi:hypothetical protein